MSQNQKIPPKLFIRPTGATLKMPVIVPSFPTMQDGAQRKVYILKKPTKVPAMGVVPSVKTINPHCPEDDNKSEAITNSKVPSALKEVKEEPLDEDAPGMIANITGSQPINLQDFMRTPLPPLVNTYLHSNFAKLKEVEQGSSPEPRTSSQPADIASALNMKVFNHSNETSPKRARKPTRHDDYVYDQMDSEDQQQFEPPSAKQSRVTQPDGCRCEYIVPELERKMDRLMEKMHYIETLAKSLLSREISHTPEKNTELLNAQMEVQQLRRQLIIQRNQNSLNRPEA